MKPQLVSQHKPSDTYLPELFWADPEHSQSILYVYNDCFILA